VQNPVIPVVFPASEKSVNWYVASSLGTSTLPAFRATAPPTWRRGSRAPGSAASGTPSHLASFRLDVTFLQVECHLPSGWMSPSFRLDVTFLQVGCHLPSGWMSPSRAPYSAILGVVHSRMG
jgi:hypothetical protein